MPILNMGRVAVYFMVGIICATTENIIGAFLCINLLGILGLYQQKDRLVTECLKLHNSLIKENHNLRVALLKLEGGGKNE